MQQTRLELASGLEKISLRFAPDTGFIQTKSRVIKMNISARFIQNIYATTPL
jgi:hypothetical protein